LKCLIFKTINYEILDKNIALYKETNEQEPYLFMSGSTLQTLSRNVDTNLYTIITFTNLMGSYKGYRIYQNDDLAYGEVELR